MKILKYAVLVLGGLIVLAGAAGAYLAATFDPNQYKAQIIQAVKEKTQRTLKLEGKIALSFWPSVGASLGKASLSERGSEKEFAAVEEARVSLKLIPLLSKQAVVDAIRIKGLRASFVKTKESKTNVDDLVSPGPTPAAAEPGFGLDIAGVEITDATIEYTDQAAGSKMVLSKLNLKTGRIAPGVPTGIEGSVRAQSDKPKFDLQVTLKTKLAFQPGQSVALDEFALEAKGAAAGITNLALKAAGNAAANLKSDEFTASKLSAALTGASGKDSLDLKLDAPRLAFTADKASGDKVTVVARINGPDGTIQATLSLSAFEGTSEAFKSSALALDLDGKKGDLTVKARIDSPLHGNVKARQFSLPQVKAGISASGPGLPGKSIAGELAGDVSADLAKENAVAHLAGKLADSNIKGQLGVADFSPLRFSFNLDIDQLDVDRFSQPPPPTAQKAPAIGQKPVEKPFDLSALRDLNAAGTLHVGALKANNVRASDVRLDLKAANGRVDLNPLTANFYQGTLASEITVDAASATPTFAVRHNMSGISIGPFLKDLANNDSLEGRGNVTLDVTTQGNTVATLKKGLNGSAALKLADGAVKGIDIAGSIRNAKAKLGALRGEHTQPADKAQKTDFSELTSTFQIRNGVAHSNDLSLKSPLLRVDGGGDIKLGEDTVNYLVKTSIVGTAKGQGGRDTDELKGITVPVRVSGALAAPSYKLDFSAMVTDAAKEKAREAIGGALQKRLGGDAAKGDPSKGDPAKKDAAASGGSTRDKLRGLFGR
jgi:AsmA protein